MSTRSNFTGRFGGARREFMRTSVCREKPGNRQRQRHEQDCSAGEEKEKDKKGSSADAPMDFMSPTELTATTSNETTNGITVIRIAFTQRVPSGVTKSTA